MRFPTDECIALVVCIRRNFLEPAYRAAKLPADEGSPSDCIQRNGPSTVHDVPPVCFVESKLSCLVRYKLGCSPAWAWLVSKISETTNGVVWHFSLLSGSVDTSGGCHEAFRVSSTFWRNRYRGATSLRVLQNKELASSVLSIRGFSLVYVVHDLHEHFSRCISLKPLKPFAPLDSLTGSDTLE